MTELGLLPKLRNYYHDSGLNKNRIINKIISFGFELFIKIFHVIPKNQVVNTHGIKMKLNYGKKYGSFNRFFSLHEAEQMEFFQNVVNENDIVFDVGANEGDYALISAKKIGKNGKVFAFEPGLERIKILKENIELNLFNNIEIVPLGVSEKKGKVYFNDGICSVDSQNKETIETISLDEFSEEKRVLPNKIKIDVEGFELLVIKGMAKILNEQKNTILLIEIHPQFILGKTKDIFEIIKILIENDFVITDWITKDEINLKNFDKFKMRDNSWHIIAEKNLKIN